MNTHSLGNIDNELNIGIIIIIRTTRHLKKGHYQLDCAESTYC